MQYPLLKFAMIFSFALLVSAQSESVAFAADSGSRSSTDKVLLKEAKKIEKGLPKKLSDYSLLSFSAKLPAVDIRTNCEDMSEYPDAHKLGFKGEVCMKSARFVYTDSKNKRQVSVSLVDIPSGKTVLAKYLNQTAENITLGKSAAFREGKSEFGWWTSGAYDLVLISGYSTHIDPGNPSLKLMVEESSDNPLTSYFLKKYKPIKAPK